MLNQLPANLSAAAVAVLKGRVGQVGCCAGQLLKKGTVIGKKQKKQLEGSWGFPRYSVAAATAAATAACIHVGCFRLSGTKPVALSHVSRHVSCMIISVSYLLDCSIACCKNQQSC